MSSSKMRIQTLDIETTMADPEESRSSSNPWYKDNRIVAIGAKYQDEDDTFTSYHDKETTLVVEYQPIEPVVLVGHNIKFDLQYIRMVFESDSAYNKYIDGNKIWDTQIAEYILTGKRSKFASLNEVAEKRGLGIKLDLKFTSPSGAAAYDEPGLIPYLKRDIKLTEAVALAQMEEATDDQFNLIIQMGEPLKAVAEMEHNGMYIDVKLMEKRFVALCRELADTITIMNAWLNQSTVVKDKPEWYNSNHIMSSIIFGGNIHYKEQVSVGIYKTGKRKGTVKYSNKDRVLHIEGIVAPWDVSAHATKLKTKDGGLVYQVDEAIINKILKGPLLVGQHNFLHNVLKLRASNKVINTYYLNLLNINMDGIIHHSLNQTQTSTGRLSSSKPNLQNVPIATSNKLMNVKACFTSRYGPDGVILEVDFKQLEVCALAWYTKDPQLIADIKLGLDIHAQIAAEIGWDSTDKADRRDVKTVVFAMIYGAGAKGIAKSSGLPLGLVKRVMQGFNERYPTIKTFYDYRSDVIAKNVHYDILTRDAEGNPCPMFSWTSGSGRTYMMKQDPYRPGPAYTQARNYPIQGTATGDIVPVVLGEIAHVLRNAKGFAVKMVNTTHDSITFDCKDMNNAGALRSLLDEEVFEALPELINEKLPNLKWDIPLEVEYEYGPSWGDMKVLDK